MESVCGIWLGHGWVCPIRIGSRRRASKHALAIRRSILCVLLYRPGSAGGRTCDPELFCLYSYEAVGQAAIRPELPLYSDRGAAGRPPYLDHVVVVPHYAREMCALVPPHRIEVAVCVSGSSWLGA